MIKRVHFAVFLLCLISILGCEKRPTVQWEKFTPEVMEEAMSGDQPILAYFYAAWCPPCFELRDTTFSDPNVIQTLEQYRRIKFDMSFKRSPKIIALHKEYGVLGLPHMILIHPSDPPSKWTRVRGYVGPSRFLQYIERFASQHSN